MYLVHNLIRIHQKIILDLFAYLKLGLDWEEGRAAPARRDGGGILVTVIGCVEDSRKNTFLAPIISIHSSPKSWVGEGYNQCKPFLVTRGILSVPGGSKGRTEQLRGRGYPSHLDLGYAYTAYTSCWKEEMNTNLRDFKGEKFGCSMVHSSFGWFHARVLVVTSEQKKMPPKIGSREVEWIWGFFF